MKLFISALAAFIFSSSVFAQGIPDKKDPPSEAESAPEDLINPLLFHTGPYVGYRFRYFDYAEPSPNVREYGPLNGLAVGYDGILPRPDFFYKAELEYLLGKMNYSGSYQNGNPLEANSDDRTALLRLQLGLTTNVTENSAWQFYTGLMFRYLYDYVQASGGYRREISQISYPLGVTYRKALQKWAYGLTAELDTLITGTVKSYLSDVGPTYSDIKNKQSLGYGAKIGADLEFPLKQWTLVVQPSFQYWLIDDSDVTSNSHGSYVEPSNTSKMYNLSLILKF